MELVSNKGGDVAIWIEELFSWPLYPLLLLPLAERTEKERKCMLTLSYYAVLYSVFSHKLFLLVSDQDVSFLCASDIFS
jgi:hypothetical protein